MANSKSASQTATMISDGNFKSHDGVVNFRFQKPTKDQLSSILAIASVVVFIFLVDQLLLGRPNEGPTILSEVLQNISGLDCCCTVIPLAFIALQLARKRPGPSKNTKQGGRRLDNGDSARAAPWRKPLANPVAKPVTKWNEALNMAVQEGDAKKAARLLTEFESQSDGQPGNWPDHMSYNLVIRAFAKKGDYQGAERWLRRMLASGLEATACSYNTLLDACAKAGQPEVCEAWLAQMKTKGIETNVISYATVIYARARRGELQHAEAWYQEMIEVGVKPDAVCYNSLIHACGVSGNPAGAEQWIEEMQKFGFEATVTTYTAVIDACAKGMDVQRAEKWLMKMLETDVQPNVVTFSALIDACAKTCDPARAEYWHAKMVEHGVSPNAHSFSALINACAKAGKVAKAEEWLARFEEIVGSPADVVAYSCVIDACGKVGDAERATSVFQRMEASGIRPHIVAYAALARPYAYRGDWVEVERIADEIQARGIHSNEYFLYAQLLAYACAKPQQGARAEECFRQALLQGLKANDHVVTVLVRAVGHERCVELMQELCNGRSIPVAPAKGRGKGVVKKDRRAEAALSKRTQSNIERMMSRPDAA